MANEELPIVQYKSPSAKVLAELLSSHADLSFVVGCCERLEQDGETIGEDPTYLRALWSAALVAYVRAIWDPQRKWIRSALEKRLGDFDGNPLKFHQYLKDMRDKYVSHSVNPYEDFRIGLTLPPEGKDSEGVLSVTTLGFQLLDQPGNAATLEKVARAFLETLNSLIANQNKVILDEAKAIPVSKHRSSRPLKLTVPGSEKVGKRRKGGF